MGWSMIAITILNIVVNMMVMLYSTVVVAWLNFKIFRARFAYWRKGSKLSVFWTGIPIFKP